MTDSGPPNGDLAGDEMPGWAQGVRLDLAYEWGGMRFRPAIPECHEHCEGCMSTGCPHPEHRPDWTLGYVTGPNDETDAPLWLCPLCFDWYRAPLSLVLDPDVPFPRTSAL